MPKCTVTVNQNHELVHPSSESFATANSLLTADTLPNTAIDGLKLKCEYGGVEYQVELSVSIENIGEGNTVELIPQINLKVL